MTKYLKYIPFIVYLICANTSNAQQLTQSIQGKVMDAVTEIPLVGVNVVIMQNDTVPSSKGAVTDEKGFYKINLVAIGKVTLSYSYIGFKSKLLRNITLSSGKVLVLNIKLEEQIFQFEEVEINAKRKKDVPLNKMAVVSARSFSIDETERYAGSLGDPARMATNFAGVRASSDQVNDIIIRGNSPSGLLWRLEGINIPNPNHFGSMGSTGGPISMLNNNVLSNSDFITSAFPAEYGNALAGVFDLHMRTGNNQKRESVAQFGFNGFELGLEGPFSKKKKRSSYLINYRYNNLDLFNKLGFDFGLSVVPKFQDLNFKVDVPVSNYSKFSIFGLGGMNSIRADFGNDTIDSKYSLDSKIGILGASFKTHFSTTTSLKLTLAITYQELINGDYKIIGDSIWESYSDKNTEHKRMLAAEFRKKINSKNSLKTGINIDHVYFNYTDSIYLSDYNSYFSNYNIDDDLLLFESYFQWNHHFSEKLNFVAGLHHQQISLNDEISIEPRLGLSWQVSALHKLSFGYGKHSQSQARFVYFIQSLVDPLQNIYNYSNTNLLFSKSHHFVIGYDWLINENHRIKIETYYQSLYDIPVESFPSYLSMLNFGASFNSQDMDSLINDGTGCNYGIEFTLEKFLSNQFYYLATLSIFNSTYVGSDGLERNTMFNGNYVFNLLGGYEFALNNNNSLIIDLKGSWAGGTKKIPIDLEKSIAQGRTYYVYDEAFESKFPDYYRFDIKISYKLNRPKSSHQFALDLSNFTNHKNRFVEYYDNSLGEIVEVGQIGILPVVLYRVQF